MDAYCIFCYNYLHGVIFLKFNRVSKGLAAVLLGMVILSGSTEARASSVIAGTTPPEILSEAVVLMDGETGQVIFGKNADMQLMPASTTKMMTALLVMEHAKLEDIVTVGKNPPYAEGASMGFKEGEQVSVKDLLYSMVLHSANDSAEILAEHISGSVEEFALLMNEKAKELGAKNTHFANPHGLTNEEHYTTAYDLSLISREVAKDPYLVDIFHTSIYKLGPTNLTPERWASNKNSLLKKSDDLYYEPALVAKTGYTPDARYAYTAVASKDGKTYIVSILKSTSQAQYYKETLELFNWAFEKCSVVKLYSKGQTLKTVTLKNGDQLQLQAECDFYVISTDGEIDASPMLVYDETSVFDGEYAKGQVVSEASVRVNGSDAGTLKLVAASDVFIKTPLAPEAGFTIPKVLVVVVMVVVILIAVLLTIRMINLRRRRRRRSRRTSQKLREYKERQMGRASGQERDSIY
jgi:D-alanyl-D-alanine carboxypeptidase